VSDAEKAIQQLQFEIKPMSISEKALQYALSRVNSRYRVNPLKFYETYLKEIKKMGEGKNKQVWFYSTNTKDISNDSYFEDMRKKYHLEKCKNDCGVTISLPEIEDVEVINDCVTIVTFSDGTKEKAVLDKADIFNLEQGISICITKKLLAQITGFGGTKVYNGLIKRAIKKHKAKLDSIEKSKQIEEQKKKKYDKIAAKKAKRKAAQREARINEQAEAYRRALQSMNTSNSAE